MKKSLALITLLVTIALPAKADKSPLSAAQEQFLQSSDRGYFAGQWATYEADGFEVEREMVRADYEAYADPYGLNNLGSYSTFIPFTAPLGGAKALKSTSNQPQDIERSDSAQLMKKIKQ
jgi:hypothetical protein